jgi:hypothetical protein
MLGGAPLRGTSTCTLAKAAALGLSTGHDARTVVESARLCKTRETPSECDRDKSEQTSSDREHPSDSPGNMPQAHFATAQSTSTREKAMQQASSMSGQQRHIDEMVVLCRLCGLLALNTILPPQVHRKTPTRARTSASSFPFPPRMEGGGGRPTPRMRAARMASRPRTIAKLPVQTFAALRNEPWSQNYKWRHKWLMSGAREVVNGLTFASTSQRRP